MQRKKFSLVIEPFRAMFHQGVFHVVEKDSSVHYSEVVGLSITFFFVANEWRPKFPDTARCQTVEESLNLDVRVCTENILFYSEHIVIASVR